MRVISLPLIELRLHFLCMLMSWAAKQQVLPHLPRTLTYNSCMLECCIYSLNTAYLNLQLARSNSEFCQHFFSQSH
jgi:hypothetical protein